jgi:hypothetical protein
LITQKALNSSSKQLSDTFDNKRTFFINFNQNSSMNQTKESKESIKKKCKTERLVLDDKNINKLNKYKKNIIDKLPPAGQIKKAYTPQSNSNNNIFIFDDEDDNIQNLLNNKENYNSQNNSQNKSQNNQKVKLNRENVNIMSNNKSIKDIFKNSVKAPITRKEKFIKLRNK